jgi:ribonuclease BN (tRNA processing enzyme)
MFDCGPASTYKMAQIGLHPLDIDYLFFTHHHFDHDVDFPCFMLTRWDESIGKENQLNVFGPNYTESITERLVGEEGAFAYDLNARRNHPLSQSLYEKRGGTLPRPRINVKARDVGPGTVFTGNDFEITAAPAEHVQPYLDSLAYRLDTSEGSIVFTGDTEPCERVVELARGADALVSMCGNFESVYDERRPADVGQTGTLGAAEMAAEAGVKQLFLVHVGPDLSAPENRERGIAEVKTVFDGEVTLTDELQTYDWHKHDHSHDAPVADPETHPHIHRH